MSTPRLLCPRQGGEEARGLTENGVRVLCSASKEAVESARLTLDDVKALVAYYQPLYFAHYALVQAIFGARPALRAGGGHGGSIRPRAVVSLMIVWCVSCAFQDMRSLLRVRARETCDHSSLSSFAHTCSSAFFSVLYDMY